MPVRQHFNSPSHVGSVDAVMRLSQVIGEALDVNFRFQLAGGPDWLDQQTFVVHATAEADVDRQLALMSDEEAKAEKRRMLLRLLQDRFGFIYHYEQRSGLTYFLSVQKENSGLQPGTGQQPGSGIVSSGAPSDIRLTAHNAKMSQFVGLMSYYLKAPVVDQTALNGTYDFKVHFNARPDLQSGDVDSGPLPEKALSSQLGLKLVRGKAPMRIAVIDALKEPSPN